MRTVAKYNASSESLVAVPLTDQPSMFLNAIDHEAVVDKASTQAESYAAVSKCKAQHDAQGA
jgi:hypothetical protein